MVKYALDLYLHLVVNIKCLCSSLDKCWLASYRKFHFTYTFLINNLIGLFIKENSL